MVNFYDMEMQMLNILWKRFVRLMNVSHLMLFVIGGLFSGQILAADPQNSAALELVQKYGLGNNLSPIVIKLVKSNTGYQTLLNKVGMTRSELLLQEEVKQLLPKYQPTWNGYLASSYAKYLTPEEILSLREEGQSSKYYAKVAKVHNQISDNMRILSQKMLTEYSFNVINNALIKAKE